MVVLRRYEQVGEIMQKKSNKKESDEDPQKTVLQAVNDIKRLLVLVLLKNGATQTEIAKTLETTQATVSRQFRIGDVKRTMVEVDGGNTH
jgi:DNA-directed RNA polymerase specialized sigma subunit